MWAREIIAVWGHSLQSWSIHSHTNALIQRIQPRLPDNDLVGRFCITSKFANQQCSLCLWYEHHLHTHRWECDKNSTHQRAIHLLVVKVTSIYKFYEFFESVSITSSSSDVIRRCVLRAEPPPPCFEFESSEHDPKNRRFPNDDNISIRWKCSWPLS